MNESNETLSGRTHEPPSVTSSLDQAIYWFEQQLDHFQTFWESRFKHFGESEKNQGIQVSDTQQVPVENLTQVVGGMIGGIGGAVGAVGRYTVLGFQYGVKDSRALFMRIKQQFDR